MSYNLKNTTWNKTAANEGQIQKFGKMQLDSQNITYQLKHLNSVNCVKKTIAKTIETFDYWDLTACQNKSNKQWQIFMFDFALLR